MSQRKTKLLKKLAKLKNVSYKTLKKGYKNLDKFERDIIARDLRI